jgi:hypothetical protein
MANNVGQPPFTRCHLYKLVTRMKIEERQGAYEVLLLDSNNKGRHLQGITHHTRGYK